MGYVSGIKWNDNLIESEIKRAMTILDTNCMPSISEIHNALGDYGLTNKIAKTGGTRFWAKKLDIKIKDSDTKTGQNYEGIATRLIKEKGFKVDGMTTKYPFDLLVNDSIRIDVKVSRPGYIENCRVHTFRTAKKYATCDLYFMIALNEKDEIEKIFIIPGNELKIVTMCIGNKSKYEKYLNKWDLIEKYDQFYKHLA